jgi:tRNA A-37 threonylcarbamoyl transferase component Bud32
MKIHCPECTLLFDVSADAVSGELTCPRCSSSFSLGERETVVYAGPPPWVSLVTASSQTIAHDSADIKPSGEGATAIVDSVLNGTAATGDADFRAGKLLAGYIVERQIGKGGMGVVYLATQASLGRKVALKVLPKRLAQDPDFVRRFNREAKALANLNHPNIVSIVDKGYEDGTYYFAMEYVDGVSLRTLLDEEAIAPADVLRMIPQICAALEYAHGEGVYHRDIKPDNIMIDRTGKVKLADFGLSKIIRGDMKMTQITNTNVIMGTLDYMAPEQRESSRDVDHRADIYSLGVVLYEMLTGELPIGNFPPASHATGLNPQIDTIIGKVLARDPDNRFQRVSQVSDALSSVVVNDQHAANQTVMGRKAKGERWCPADSSAVQAVLSFKEKIRHEFWAGWQVPAVRKWMIITFVLAALSVVGLPWVIGGWFLYFWMKPTTPARTARPRTGWRRPTPPAASPTRWASG